MPKLTCVIDYDGLDIPDVSPLGTFNAVLLVTRTAEYLEALTGGRRIGSVSLVNGTGTAATGTVTIASGSGTITATINGVATNVTWATSDTATATALASAINANASTLVSGLVTATSALGVVTITAKALGPEGNAYTLAATGTGTTTSGARLTGGAANTNTTVTLSR